MRLLRGLWKLLVGIKDGLVLLAMLLFFGIVYAALSMSPNPVAQTEGALVLDLNGSLVEQPQDANPLALIPGSGPVTREYRLRDLVRSLEAAAISGTVKAVVLDLDGFTGGGQAAIAVVGEALDKVRAKGKPVFAFATGYVDDSYQLAAHASEVWLDPMGAVLVAGPGGTQLYYKGLLDKIGVTPKIYRVGEFKSAVEPFIRTDQSEPARAANQALADSLWSAYLDDVRKARPTARLVDYIRGIDTLAVANRPFAESARAAGLVDKLGDRVAFGKRVAEVAGAAGEKAAGGFRTVQLERWIAANPERTAGPAIGVLTIAGTITDGRAGPGSAGAETISKLLLEALAKNDLKALVVRIDSPGGSATGSERIRTAVLEARRRNLPVVISMGSVAASGGYWIATGGQTIFAEPSTITGSIGVFGILPTFTGALEKLGLSADGVATTPLSGQPDVFRGTSPEFDRLMQAGIEQFYNRFLGIVAQARGMTPQQVDGIAQGRVWAGGTARQIKLVDRFGGLDDAVAEAARLAKLDPAQVSIRFIEQPENPVFKFLASMAPNRGAAPDAFSRLAGRPEERLAGALGGLRAIVAGPAIQAHCLSCPVSGSPRPGDLAAATRLLGPLAP